ncbi:hypothetical protein FF38_03044, partial [Lucilia cuprina]
HFELGAAGLRADVLDHLPRRLGRLRPQSRGDQVGDTRSCEPRDVVEVGIRDRPVGAVLDHPRPGRHERAEVVAAECHDATVVEPTPRESEVTHKHLLSCEKGPTRAGRPFSLIPSDVHPLFNGRACRREPGDQFVELREILGDRFGAELVLAGFGYPRRPLGFAFQRIRD